MADISIGSGQGVTQAIAQNLGLSKADCKKIKLSTWQSVMSLVNDANTQSVQNKKASIFGGGNNVQGIGDKSTWKSNFQVQAGQTMQIDDSIFSKIKQLLTGTKTEAPVAAPETNHPPVVAGAESSQSVSAPKSVTTADGVYRSSSPVLVADTPLEGDVKTGKAAAEAFDNMFTSGTGEITVTSNEWRELAAKKDKTPEDIKKLDTEYNTNMQKLGNSMAQYISQTFANGGDIDGAAFEKFQNSGAMDLSGLTQDEIATLKTSNQIAFKRLDINGDGKIDAKEMSAYMMAMDFDENNRMGGSIKAEDYMRNASQLDDPNKNVLDQKLAYSYNKLYGDE